LLGSRVWLILSRAVGSAVVYSFFAYAKVVVAELTMMGTCEHVFCGAFHLGTVRRCWCTHTHAAVIIIGAAPPCCSSSGAQVNLGNILV
jgi:hypothetical protein